ncbi:MAG: SDR family oxidoreductase [Ignavibacteria bacterium]|nr:SDR family oxidoreductase [Ignavibacteria bacterium]
MKIGITGATGQLGQLVVEQLKLRNQGANIVALVRNVEKASSLQVEAREFNYSNTQQLPVALQGIERLLIISSNELGQRAIQHANIIAAAKEAGVKWIVYTSLLHADTSTLSLAAEHLQTEVALKESGIPYTILRNGWYTENKMGSVAGSVAAGVFVGSAGDGKFSSATRLDFAEAAAAVLSGEPTPGKIYELAGDDAYTLTELAAEISRQTGKDIPYKNLPESEYAALLQTFGVPEIYATAIAGWDVSAASGDLFDSGKELSALIGRPTTPLAKTITATLEAGK